MVYTKANNCALNISESVKNANYRFTQQNDKEDNKRKKCKVTHFEDDEKEEEKDSEGSFFEEVVG